MKRPAGDALVDNGACGHSSADYELDWHLLRSRVTERMAPGFDPADLVAVGATFCARVLGYGGYVEGKVLQRLRKGRWRVLLRRGKDGLWTPLGTQDFDDGMIGRWILRSDEARFLAADARAARAPRPSSTPALGASASSSSAKRQRAAARTHGRGSSAAVARAAPLKPKSTAKVAAQAKSATKGKPRGKPKAKRKTGTAPVVPSDVTLPRRGDMIEYRWYTNKTMDDAGGSAIGEVVRMLQTARPKEQQRCTLLFRNTLHADGTDQPWEFDRDLKLSEYGQQWRYPHAPMVGQHRDLATNTARQHQAASHATTPAAAAATAGNPTAAAATTAAAAAAGAAGADHDLLKAAESRQPSRTLQLSPARTDTPDTDSETIAAPADAPLMHDLLAAVPPAAAPPLNTTSADTGALDAGSSTSRAVVTATKPLSLAPTEAVL